MNQPVHKRPRKSVMRISRLDASLTGRSGVLLERARFYLPGDEVFEELYAHAVDLEEQINGTEAADAKEAHEQRKEALDAFRESVDGVKKDLERKQEDLQALRKRFSNVIEDEIGALLDKELALPGVAGEAADLLMAVKDHVRALVNDIDDFPTLEEEVGQLEASWEDADYGQ